MRLITEDPLILDEGVYQVNEWRVRQIELLDAPHQRDEDRVRSLAGKGSIEFSSPPFEKRE